VGFGPFMIFGDEFQNLRFPQARSFVVAQLQLRDADPGVDLGGVASAAYGLLEMLLRFGESTRANRGFGSLNFLFE
jgi:hypothetical protein